LLDNPDGLREGVSVGTLLGVPERLGRALGVKLGMPKGSTEGTKLGRPLGDADGLRETLGLKLGVPTGLAEGTLVGIVDGMLEEEELFGRAEGLPEGASTGCPVEIGCPDGLPLGTRLREGL
jgi:hypothetical protein